MAFPKGNTPWNKGLKVQLSDDISGLELGHQKGKKNQNWKGDKAGYSAIHYWIVRQLGKASYCSLDKSHKSTRFHWANISGQYKRDVKDFMSLCPSCHFKNDNIGRKMWEARKVGASCSI
jgi:hypothetical protein